MRYRMYKLVDFFNELIMVDTDKEAGLSARRFVLVISGMALSLSTILLAVAAVFGVDTEMSLWAVTTPLSALAGTAYISKREQREKHERTLSKIEAKKRGDI